MLKRIQNYFLLKNIETHLLERDLSGINNKVVSLGFLVDEDFFNDFERLYQVAYEMGLQHKDVNIFTFNIVKKKSPSLRQNQINNKEFSWNGLIQNQNAKEFLEIPYDVLVGFYKCKNVFLNLMMAKSKANFKVGFFGSDIRLFDLEINIAPVNVNDFEKEMLKYLRVLNKID